ncbi:MAG: hypothetical protein PF961_22305 [Planctomycetota bacterium]|jgi:hypothetical protein|nr:hypothetical protein [Planctomycetota bacterium]
MDFDTSAAGVFQRSHGTPIKVCEQTLEFVSFSELDRTHYLRWPADNGYFHMAALPEALLDGPDSALQAWARHHKISPVGGHMAAFGAFLRQQALVRA